MNKDNNRKVSIVNIFNKSIPREIQSDIEYLVDKTKEDNRERSITMCNVFYKGNRIQTGGYATGNKGSTEVVDCNPNLGKSVKIGDVRTHPIREDTPGDTPSVPDFIGNASDSARTGVRQISCITNHECKMIHCFRPKLNMGYEKANKYIENYMLSENDLDANPFLRENIPKDFEHLYYDRHSFKFIRKPKVNDIVDDALGKSVEATRSGKHFNELEKGTFCELIADYNVGDSMPLNQKVANACRDKLRRYSILGFKFSSKL